MCSNDIRCAELLFGHQSALLARFPCEGNRNLISDIMGNPVNMCSALGHTKLLEFLLDKLAAETEHVPSTWANLRVPPFTVLPFCLKHESSKMMLYSIAFNQHELLSSLLNRMRICIYEHHPMAAFIGDQLVDINRKEYQQAILERGPFFLLSPGNSNEEGQFERNTFSIEINHFMLLEMLDRCAAYGAYECARLILEKFHSDLPAVLRNRKAFFFGPDFSCYAIQHGA